MFDADGRNREALTDDDYFNTDPEISPNDADVVAYSSYRGDHLILDDRNPDPNAPEIVREPDDIHYDPFSWQIIVRNAAHRRRDPDHQGPRRATTCLDHPIDCDPGDGSGWKPVWTPDGKQVGYTGVLDRTHHLHLRGRRRRHRRATGHPVPDPGRSSGSTGSCPIRPRCRRPR